MRGFGRPSSSPSSPSAAAADIGRSVEAKNATGSSFSLAAQLLWKNIFFLFSFLFIG
jgi:hypothetical protein